MTEALKLLIISICLNCGDNQDKLEYIHFYNDSIRIVNTKWDIISSSDLDTYGDKVYKGMFNVRNDTTNAIIMVAGKHVLFSIPSRGINIQLYQIQHEARYYKEEDLN